VDEPPDRDVVLGAAGPRELFGDAVDDPRELRRVYAGLLKAFHAEDEPEAHAHVRALYEEARAAHEAPPPIEGSPRSAADAVVATFGQGNSALLAAIAEHHEVLRREEPGLLSHAVHRAIAHGGPSLDTADLDLLDAVVRDPRWAIHPDALDQLDMGLSRIRQLRAACADPDVPAPLRDLLKRRWGLPDAEVAELYLEIAEQLRWTNLAEAFAHLEQVHPAALGHIVGARHRIVHWVLDQPPPPLPKRQRKKLRRDFPPSTKWLDEWYDRVAGRVEMLPVRIVLTVVLVVLLMPYVHFFVAVIGGYLLRVVVLAIVAFGIGATRSDKALLRAHSGNTYPLIELCREHTLFPEEVARVIYETPVEYDDEAYGFAPGHPVLALEQDDAALFRVISSAHVQRVRTAIEEASDEG